MKTSKLNGAAMAMMVAGLFAVTTMSASAADKTATGTGDTASVKCMHSSSCKGKGACKQATNSCKGQNSCKGEGFTMQKTQQDCEAAQAAAKQS
ncbi:hypothetical protein [Dyella silvae]|uniref:BufA2 family periplasmic bufferin-type metallophore n=1 Tax=Dyella silvae TaxID=2994424 RepID=UPI002263D641|nr:hypothetical protein [Dyella silvae]